MSEPVICFGQQPCGFFPNRFLFAKIKTARRLQSESGGKIIFFLHDSDHDHRETATALTNCHTRTIERLNFEIVNKIQKLYSPLYRKNIASGWKDKTLRCLPNLVSPELVEIFSNVNADNVAEFCIQMYRATGLLEGVELVRSSAPEVRNSAMAVEDFFADVPYQGETVRARNRDGRFYLHKGGDSYIEVEVDDVRKDQISPTRDSRLRWMQSVIACTHYIAGEGEIQYLNRDETPEIQFVKRDFIDRSGEAYAECKHEW